MPDHTNHLQEEEEEEEEEEDEEEDNNVKSLATARG